MAPTQDEVVDENKRLKDQISRLMDELVRAEEGIAKRQEHVRRSLRAEMESMKQEHDAQMEELEEEIARLKAQVEQLEANVAEMDEELMSASEYCAALEKKIKDGEGLRKHIAQLEAELDKAEAELDEADNMRKENEELQEQLQDAFTRMRELQEAAEQAQDTETLEALRTEIERLKADVDTVSSEKKDLEDQVRDAAIKRLELERNLTTADEENDRLRAEVAALRAEAAQARLNRKPSIFDAEARAAAAPIQRVNSRSRPTSPNSEQQSPQFRAQVVGEAEAKEELQRKRSSGHSRQPSRAPSPTSTSDATSKPPSRNRDGEVRIQRSMSTMNRPWARTASSGAMANTNGNGNGVAPAADPPSPAGPAVSRQVAAVKRAQSAKLPRRRKGPGGNALDDSEEEGGRYDRDSTSSRDDTLVELESRASEVDFSGKDYGRKRSSSGKDALLREAYDDFAGRDSRKEYSSPRDGASPREYARREKDHVKPIPPSPLSDVEV